MAIKLSPANVNHLLQIANRLRKGTLVTLERAATVWKFRSAHSGAVYKEGGYRLLHLTAEQDALAVANLRKSYMVL